MSRLAAALYTIAGVHGSGGYAYAASDWYKPLSRDFIKRYRCTVGVQTVDEWLTARKSGNARRRAHAKATAWRGK